MAQCIKCGDEAGSNLVCDAEGCQDTLLEMREYFKKLNTKIIEQLDKRAKKYED